MQEIYTLIQTIGGLTLGAAAVFTWVLTRNAAIYANFDTLYKEILNIGLTYPCFRDPEKTAKYREHFNGDERIRYETYAYMVFNVCETVADSLDLYPGRSDRILDQVESCFCRFLPFIADREWLKKTWTPVLVYEKRLHGRWLADQRGGVRFKEEFLNWIQTLN